ncbi:uncharacterized protein LOC118216966 isoform X1 [Anguilla anguilla]|uniref:uncharacterized protein LOC118216966 isoform X1 n=1 Tax=Anguilla anguilla TaxID=7936 RepID=UPI0015AB5C5B|nr:uncharacterized protein LOC118216966 isoform X1 [Anguilla anguilla]
MTTQTAFENSTLAVHPGALNPTTTNHNMTRTRPSIQRDSTKVDWILYVVPASAFLLGLCLFSLVLIKHKRREERIRRLERLRKMRLTQRRVNGYSTESEDKAEETCKAQSAETQSYENVEAAIYFNQKGVTYYVPEADGDDYVTPDAEGCETDRGTAETQNDVNYLQPFQNLTDTDGESYENMEISLYAQPRKRTDTDTQDGDYVEPNETCEAQEEGEKHCNHQTDTDDESYENMAGSTYSQRHNHSDPCRPHTATAVQEEVEEEDSYVKMASIT